jgi:hypothetical protein
MCRVYASEGNGLRDVLLDLRRTEAIGRKVSETRNGNFNASKDVKN